jgi:hypothetical protein
MRTLVIILIMVLFISYVALGGTGLKVSVPETSENRKPGGEQGKEVKVLYLKCRETVCFMPVDPDIAESLIPTNHTLYTNDRGAEILVIAQDCSKAAWEGTEHAPLQMAHIWIRLVGPDTISPIDGVQETIPTFYWWDYAGKTTKESFSREVTKTGKKMDLIDSVEFTLMSHGRVIDRMNEANTTFYEWSTSPSARQETLGINHIVHGRKGNKNIKLLNSGIIKTISRNGLTKFSIGEGSVLAVFGSELYGSSLDFNMSFKAVLETILEADN